MFFIEHAKSYEEVYSSLKAVKIPASRKKKIEDIIKYRQILGEQPPSVVELSSIGKKELDRICKEYFEKARDKMGLAKF